MARPNIFEIAMSKLSQDAFFTWLIEWADNSNEKSFFPSAILKIGFGLFIS
jgi:hypothetical protein